MRLISKQVASLLILCGVAVWAPGCGTPEHAALAAAVIGLLFADLRKGRFRVYDAALRVRVPATGLATYPDVTVVRGPRERDATDPQVVTNPTLIVEVLSRGTEEYDRGDKTAATAGRRQSRKRGCGGGGIRRCSARRARAG